MNDIAIWAITPNGVALARRLLQAFPKASIHLSASTAPADFSAVRFERLSAAVSEAFTRHDGHLFIMSTGIVVRVIAPLLRNKTVDPAVVVIDELGLHAISLVAGHIGGANALARRAAAAIDAVPVITTATDLNRIPAIDTLACELGLAIENPGAIKGVSMALLTERQVRLHDPFGLVRDRLPPEALIRDTSPRPEAPEALPGIYVDDRVVDLPRQVLILRPRSLAVGMGCNRGTPAEEMRALLRLTLERFGLSPLSLLTLASVDLKQDEAGLLSLAESLGIPLVFFDRETLKQVSAVPTPSAMVEKHIGVKSVCEAAAILAAESGRLIVPKQRTKNVTAAVARISSMSSASAPAGRTISAFEPTTCSRRSPPSPDTPPTST